MRKDTLFTPDDAKRIREQIADWKSVLAAYRRDFAEGVALVETKDDRCTLCPKFKRAIHIKKNGVWYKMLSCRRCPIVKDTGRTCAHLRDYYSLPVDYYLRPEYAIYGVSITISKLEFILKHIEAKLHG